MTNYEQFKHIPVKSTELIMELNGMSVEDCLQTLAFTLARFVVVYDTLCGPDDAIERYRSEVINAYTDVLEEALPDPLVKIFQRQCVQ